MESQSLLKLFEGKGKKSFQVPKSNVDYNFKMLQHFMNHLSTYKVMMAETDVVIADEIKDNLFKTPVIAEIEEELELSSRLFKIIGADESLKLWEATELWLKLEPNNSNHTQLFDQYKYSFLNDLSLSAYYFNPHADRKSLQFWQGKIQIFAIQKLSANGTKSFGMYRRLNEEFSLYRERTVEPIDYWDLLKDDHNELSELAIKLLTLPCSTTYEAHCLLSENHGNRGPEFSEQCMTLSYHIHYNDC